MKTLRPECSGLRVYSFEALCVEKKQLRKLIEKLRAMRFVRRETALRNFACTSRHFAIKKLKRKLQMTISFCLMAYAIIAMAWSISF
jgi:hypothetical protein